MIPARINPGAKPNDKNVRIQRRKNKGEPNSQWVERAVQALGGSCAVVLFGGTDLIHFRLRVAQSHARSDLLPSFWSHAALCDPTAPVSRRLVHVPPLPPLAAGPEVPRHNGILDAPLTAFDDPGAFPNVAVLTFATPKAVSSTPLVEAQRLKSSRQVEDFVSPMVRWLGFVWGAADCSNPLLSGHGMPAASFVESAYGACGVDLTPGVAERAVCPESLWQAALWWRDYYQQGPAKSGANAGPAGRFILDQAQAAVLQ